MKRLKIMTRIMAVLFLFGLTGYANAEEVTIYQDGATITVDVETGYGTIVEADGSRGIVDLDAGTATIDGETIYFDSNE